MSERDKGNRGASFLAKMLAAGRRRIDVAIWDESQRPYAIDYVKTWTNGYPTEGRGAPDVRIVVDDSPGVRTVSRRFRRSTIRYHYSAK